MGNQIMMVTCFSWLVRGLIQTNLGAITDDNVIVFSGGITSAFVLPIITKQSPDGTDFTLPLNHPEFAAVAAISIARVCTFEYVHQVSLPINN